MAPKVPGTFGRKEAAPPPVLAANHLLHMQIPAGSLLELSPTQIELARLDDEQGGYAIVATDGAISVRIVLPPDDYVTLIRSANEQLDTQGAPSGKLQIAKSLPPELANGRG